jgi:hypothetical protein
MNLGRDRVMNALIVGTILFGTINLVFFGGLHVIMEIADRRRLRAHMCADRGSWCEFCLDDKQRAGVVDMFGNVMVKG